MKPTLDRMGASCSKQSKLRVGPTSAAHGEGGPGSSPLGIAAHAAPEVDPSPIVLTKRHSTGPQRTVSLCASPTREPSMPSPVPELSVVAPGSGMKPRRRSSRTNKRLNVSAVSQSSEAYPLDHATARSAASGGSRCVGSLERGGDGDADAECAALERSPATGFAAHDALDMPASLPAEYDSPTPGHDDDGQDEHDQFHGSPKPMAAAATPKHHSRPGRPTITVSVREIDFRDDPTFNDSKNVRVPGAFASPVRTPWVCGVAVAVVLEALTCVCVCVCIGGRRQVEAG